VIQARVVTGHHPHFAALRLFEEKMIQGGGAAMSAALPRRSRIAEGFQRRTLHKRPEDAVGTLMGGGRVVMTLGIREGSIEVPPEDNLLVSLRDQAPLQFAESRVEERLQF
jgi:hypothetical protein